MMSSNIMLITACKRNHPQTKFAKFMFSQVSVCPGVGGGMRGSCPLPWIPPRHTRPLAMHTPHHACPPRHAVNEQAVRILLECILVSCCVDCSNISRHVFRINVSVFKWSMLGPGFLRRGVGEGATDPRKSQIKFLLQLPPHPKENMEQRKGMSCVEGWGCVPRVLARFKTNGSAALSVQDLLLNCNAP